LSQLIKESTHVTKDTRTLIDRIYVSNDCNFSTAGVIPLGISDHHLTFVIRKKNKSGPNKHTTVKYRDYKNLDENKLLEDMHKIDWESIRTMTDVNQMWSAFKNNFMKVIDVHLPFKERRINIYIALRFGFLC
jgi:hypothetical protein